MILKRADQSFIMGFKVVDVFLSLLLFRGGIQYPSEDFDRHQWDVGWNEQKMMVILKRGF